jgi:hypothetical protein
VDPFFIDKEGRMSADSTGGPLATKTNTNTYTTFTSTTTTTITAAADDDEGCHLGATASIEAKKDWNLESVIQPNLDLINCEDSRIKEDVLRIILQYLQDQGSYTVDTTRFSTIH